MKIEEKAKFELIDYGYTRIEKFLNPLEVESLNLALYETERHCKSYQESRSLSSGGALHHLLLDRDNFWIYLSLLNRLEDLNPLLKTFFNSRYILNSFGGVINRPEEADTYLHKPHIDIRSAPAHMRYMINLIFLLQDFTPENGATLICPLSKSQGNADNYERFTGKAGDMFLFNSGCWHMAGKNFSSKNRNAITITLTKPFYKPQLDYCKLLENKGIVEVMNPFIQQVIGYYSRVASSWDEWYQAADRRFYKSDQG